MRRMRPRLPIVGDQPINVRFQREIFQSGHDVFAATCGADALAFSATEPPGPVRAAVEALAVPHSAADVPGGLVSISIGLASITPHHEHAMNLTLAADLAPYQAKQEGRGRVKPT